MRVKWLWMGMCGLMLLAGTDEVAKKWGEMFLRQLEAPLSRPMNVLSYAWEMFSLFERRAPQNLQELCSSSYIAVSCGDILDPIWKVPILQTKPGEGFTLEPDPERAPTGVVLTYTSPKGEKTVVRWLGNTPIPYLQNIAFSLNPESGKDWGPEKKVGIAVSRYVNRMMWDFHTVHRRIPDSMEEFRQFASKYYYFDRLRNAFTGKYAKVVSIPCSESLPTKKELEKEKIEDGTIVFCDWQGRSGTPLAYPVANSEIYTALCNDRPMGKYLSPSAPGVCRIH